MSHDSSTSKSRFGTGPLPLDLGLSEAVKAYGHRLLALALAVVVSLAFVALYVLIYELGLRALYLLAPLILACVISLLLARIEGSIGGFRLWMLRLPQAIRYPIERILSLLLLILTAPLFVVIAFAIKADSKGTIFIRRTKVGRYGRPFSRLTFRTVAVPNGHGKPNAWLDVESATVTTIGRILRATSLDELPMLINVAKGEMALFGEPPQTPDALLDSGPLYLQRLLWRPGLLQISRRPPWRRWIQSELQHSKRLEELLKVIPSGKDSRVLLVRITGRSGDHQSSVVMSFRVAEVAEHDLQRHLDEIGVPSHNALAGDASQSAALIEAAWTAWFDLPARHEDKPRDEVEPSSGARLEKGMERSHRPTVDRTRHQVGP